MAVVGMCQCASASKANLQSKRSSGFSSVVRLGPQHVARARVIRPLKQRCAVTRCEQMNGAAPEASVTCLGEALFDCLAEERGVPKEQVKTWIPYPGGAPANVAAALGRLGVKVSFVSAVGRHVDLTPVQRVPEPTRDVLVTRDEAGEREFSGFGAAKNNEYADCFIDADLIPEPTIKNSVALVTGTLGLSFPKTAAAMRKAVSYARSGPCSVLVDINWRPVFWESLSHKAVQMVSEYAGGADILKLSEEEAEWLYGVHSDQAMKQPELVLQAVPETVQGVLITAGGHGAAYCFRAANGAPLIKGFVPVLKVKVSDTTGAGDAFLSGFLYSMVKAGGLSAFQQDGDKLRSALPVEASHAQSQVQFRPNQHWKRPRP
ncbi:MAG: Fructokinase [Trebouxia sp. A1-2]|nr:MAG: Fructokinase [Trebouxia sp. A1-2]